MAILLDVNVLVALAWPNHVSHTTAVEWFVRHRSRGWATSSVTQTGFVRVSSNRAVIPDTRPPAEAILLLQQLTALEDHVLWADDIAFCRSKLVAPERLLGHRHITDAHLVALALRHKGQLATFDRGMPAVLPTRTKASDLLILLG